ncbi:hypothetical protein CLOM_g2461 [Closterium sp. NIES-68]|nr:hypothetical protein CLOM_g2461 [Closterium sp. NIES-68]GJP74351.1 hypothetical protein CLOP_g4945 [Closterium sp. NIES-67]
MHVEEDDGGDEEEDDDEDDEEGGDMRTVNWTKNNLVCGCSSQLNEILFHFVLPERPGALVKVLEPITSRWHATLFHYCRTDGVTAHVLVGLQLLPHEEAEFKSVADALGYEYSDERNNTALRIF